MRRSMHPTILTALLIVLAVAPAPSRGAQATSPAVEVPALSEAVAQASLGYHPIPAHPDLIRSLGRPEVAELHAKALRVPEKSAKFDLRHDPLLRRSTSLKGAGDKIAGTGTCLVILWEFTDHPADQGAHPGSLYHDMMFSVGVYPTGSMNDYYREVSFGQFSVGGGIEGWHTAGNTYASYANGDGSQDANTARQMIIDAIAQLDPVVDFSQYDNDGPDGVPASGDDDGYIDALFFVHAGPGQEASGDPVDIWSHAWLFWDPLWTNDGVAVYRYSVEPEEDPDGNMVTVGVFAHEYGHVLGLPDLYDTDYSSAGIGQWGLMSGGSWNHKPGDPTGSSPAHMTAWCKKELGWVNPLAISTSTPGLTIPPADANPVAYKIFRNGDASGDEYFLLEMRRAAGFDGGLVRRQVDHDLPQPEGLVVYHIDEAVSGNSSDTHRLVDVVEASPWYDETLGWYEHLDGPRNPEGPLNLSHYNRGDNGDPWPGFSAFAADSTDWLEPRDRDRFADDTIPAAEDHACEATGVALENIALFGDPATDVMLDVVIGEPGGSVMVAAYGSHTWDFETDDEGWRYCRSYVHRDETRPGSCGGGGGLWFGVDDPDFVCPGYGNNWNDITWTTVGLDVASPASITLRHRYELETGYDYVYLEVRPAGDMGADWTELAAFNGEVGCRTDELTIPAALLLQADGDDDGTAEIDIRLRLSSDGGWSGEDGEYCGDGWWVDEVTVTGGAPTAADDLPVARAQLAPAAPNPFNPATVLRYYLPAGARDVSLVIYDPAGRAVRRLAVDGAASGWLESRWDGRNERGQRVASGLYFVRFKVDETTEIQKVALVK